MKDKIREFKKSLVEEGGYFLSIEPAIDAKDRDKLQAALEWMGYHVIDSGQAVDGSFCDITFKKSN